MITPSPWRREWQFPAEETFDASAVVSDEEESGIEFIYELPWFCGCGDPWHAAAHLRDVLSNVAELRAETQTYDQFHARELVMFQHYGAALVLYHLLEHVGLLEHGGSAPGWLTDSGKALLAKLQTAPLGRDQEVK